jgi:hypothetical protein
MVLTDMLSLMSLQVKMNRMRLRIAERLKQSQNTAASLTTFNEVDMSSLMEFRKLYKDDVLKKTGVKLGFMSAFSRASVLAMRDIPAVNASIEGPNGGIGITSILVLLLQQRRVLSLLLSGILKLWTSLASRSQSQT